MEPSLRPIGLDNEYNPNLSFCTKMWSCLFGSMPLLPQVVGPLDTFSSRRWEGVMQTLPWMMEWTVGMLQSNLPEKSDGGVSLFDAGAPYYQRGPCMTAHVPSMQ